MTIDLDNIKEVYIGQGENISFACFESDGTTALNLTNSGVAELTIWRTGVNPFTITVDTGTGVEGFDYDWLDRALGTGIFYVDFSEELPLGLCRMMLRSIEASGRTEMQVSIWIRLVKAGP